MKAKVAVILWLLMVFTVTSCQKEHTGKEEKEKEAPSEVKENTERDSLARMAYLRERYGPIEVTLEPVYIKLNSYYNKKSQGLIIKSRVTNSTDKGIYIGNGFHIQNHLHVIGDYPFDYGPESWRDMERTLPHQLLSQLQGYTDSANSKKVNAEMYPTSDSIINSQTERMIKEKIRSDDFFAFSLGKWYAESVLFLKPGQSQELYTSLTSLMENKGTYRVVLDYTSEEKLHNLYKDFEPLPENIHGFQKWLGHVKSDTLVIEVD